MAEKISNYVKAHKSWAVKNVLFNYFAAITLNADIHQRYNGKLDVSFENFRDLSDILFKAKEELHLIYKRLHDPRRNYFEQADKYTPNDDEMNFITNVGLLFHKAMVARELQYMLEYYGAEEHEDYHELKVSLDDYVQRIAKLFEKGVTLLPRFLRNFQDDVIVLSYFLENSQETEAALGTKLERIFASFNGNGVSPYVKVGRYFIDSGWTKRAKKVLADGLQKDPNNSEIGDLLRQCG
ncbi:hypothetical protein JXA02_04700 [candidate division KSB1 bacterium]|nr:hypothetical protein [candidate division KSB1 bacterium]RQW08687.1 MAG: hypothetical protein EH222_05315 [candidate division KSB1 bacterium]